LQYPLLAQPTPSAEDRYRASRSFTRPIVKARFGSIHDDESVATTLRLGRFRASCPPPKQAWRNPRGADDRRL